MKMLIAFFSLFFGGLFQIGQTWAQENYWEQSRHVPIPANAAALFKSFEKPVGTCTGIPPISIPVYTCSYRGYELPITLSYHAGGIKVEELASSTGLGWSLSAGGMITRVQNGAPDEVYLNQQYKPSQYQAYSTASLYDYLNGNQDYEPDYFLFSAGGMSGKIVFNEAEHAFVVDKNLNIKVEVSTSSGIAFTLIDDKGYRYYFTTVYAGPSPNSWVLSRIEDMNGKVLISFEYEWSSYTFDVRSSSSVPTDIWGEPCTTSDNWTFENYLSQWVIEPHLKKIVSGTDTVLFTLGSREDLGTYKVNAILVKDYKGIVLKRFNFNYEYFYNAATKRLKLKSISEQPSSGSDSLTHQFSYEEYYQLPERFSNATDYWGYYNGAYNTSPIPNGIYTYFDGLSTKTKGIGDMGDRRANATYAQANILKRITLPSGGYREFTYEGNECLYSSQDYNGHLFADVNEHIPRTFTGTTLDLYGTPQYETIFAVNSTCGYSLFYFELDAYVSGVSIRIYQQYGGLVAEFDEYNGHILLPNGTYRFEMDGSYWSYFSGVYGYWDELNLTTSTISRSGSTYLRANQNAGGVRIKTITDFDPLTNKNHYTRFSYSLPEDSLLTSGLLISFPKMIYRGTCPEKNCRTMRIASNSGYPLNSDQGSYVFYTHVRVSEDNNGHVNNIYNFMPDYDRSGMEFPILPNENNSLKRGQLLSRTYYNQAGTLLKKDTIEYIDGLDDHFESGSVSLAARISIWNHINDGWIDSYSYCSDQFYNALITAPRPAVERSIVYTPSGTSQETKTIYSYYSATGASLLRKKTMIASNGDSLLTYYRYPFNNSSEFKLPLSAQEMAMRDTLKGLNCLLPLETVTFRKNGTDSIFTGGYKTTYASFYTGKRFVSTIKQYSSLNDSTTLYFSNYDSDGNLRERYKTNEIKETILWGYNNQLVVANVIGADYSTVAELVDNSVLQNPSSESALRTELNNIRTGLAGSKAQVTTYTYIPAIGVSSVTTPDGKIVYYEYDAHGRLIRVRDDNNRILNKNAYQVTQ